ncbi:MAG TPA: hypothetical protein VG963_04345 [Polyangiaceae bacterium]|nr:hypothetical protein [Polyangiaceae bacterium]
MNAPKSEAPPRQPAGLLPYRDIHVKLSNRFEPNTTYCDHFEAQGRVITGVGLAVGEHEPDARATLWIYENQRPGRAPGQVLRKVQVPLPALVSPDVSVIRIEAFFKVPVALEPGQDRFWVGFQFSGKTTLAVDVEKQFVGVRRDAAGAESFARALERPLLYVRYAGKKYS